MEDDLPGIHQRNLSARGADILDQVYPIVFEQVLGEKVSTLPVQTK